jgi:isoquinoline 1-oxidoreductase beta subunit
MQHSRRQFLEISLLSGGGLLASFALPDISRAAAADRAVDPRYTPLGAFVRIHTDNSIVIGARGCEIGQGVITSLPMLIAEELEVRWDQVRVEQLPYGLVAGAEPGKFTGRYGGQGAGGSTNIPDGWTELREAGAQIRHLLVSAPAQLWEADAAKLKTRDAMISHPDGRTATYGSLAARAAQLPLPAGPFALMKPAVFHIIGIPSPTAD